MIDLNKIVQRLKLRWWSVIAAATVFCISYEIDLIPVGVFSNNVSVIYALQMIGIIMTMLIVYSSLKLFALKKVQRSLMVEDDVEALNNFYSWSLLRIGFLGISIIYNLATYYLTLTNSGVMCALVTGFALIFCFPKADQFNSFRSNSKEETKEE